MQALQFEPTSHIVAGGALATLSGAKTGRTWVATLVAAGVCSCCSSGMRCPVGRHQGEQQGQAVCCLRPQFSSIPWWAPDLSQSPGPSPPHLLLCRPGDKRIVREAGSEGDIWWGEGSTNFEMDER